MIQTDGPYTAAERAFDKTRAVAQLDIPADSPEWMPHSRCRSADPELFHPIGDGPVAEAQAHIAITTQCRLCPVTRQCRTMRYESGSTGVFAGVWYTDAGGRRTCKRAGCPLPVGGGFKDFCGFSHAHEVVVGTTTGYKLHHSTPGLPPPCGPCAAAQRKYRAGYRLAAGRS